MVGWVKDSLVRQLDERAARRHRSTLRSEGVPLEVALTLAKDSRPRHSPFQESLGQKGHRDWTQLRARSRWLDEADEDKLDLVLTSLVRTTRAKGVEFDIQDVTNILLSKRGCRCSPACMRLSTAGPTMNTAKAAEPICNAAWHTTRCAVSKVRCAWVTRSHRSDGTNACC